MQQKGSHAILAHLTSENSSGHRTSDSIGAGRLGQREIRISSKIHSLNPKWKP